jgi:hypothetical protein
LAQDLAHEITWGINTQEPGAELIETLIFLRLVIVVGING